MNAVLWTLDVLFCASLIGLACQTLATANHFKAVVLFIVFGLMLAMSWARLDAPDVALVEAAIGAGLTGALLLSTLAAISAPAKPAPASDQNEHRAEQGVEKDQAGSSSASPPDPETRP